MADKDLQLELSINGTALNLASLAVAISNNITVNSRMSLSLSLWRPGRVLIWIHIPSLIWRLLQWEYVTFSRGKLISQEESSGEQHCDCPYPRGINSRRMLQLSLPTLKRYVLGIFLRKEHWKKMIFCYLINLVLSECSDTHKCESWTQIFRL